MSNRTRTRAIRERMTRTGEPYTLAASRHDTEHDTRTAEQPITPRHTPLRYDHTDGATAMPTVAPIVGAGSAPPVVDGG